MKSGIIKSSISFIQSIPLGEDLQNCFSGGKDSIVVYDLIKKAGVNVKHIYGNTTIDPPGTMGFIRKYYPDVEIQQPKKSFYKLVSERGLPTRMGRYCCQELKEGYGIGKRNIEGIRSDEGSKRKRDPEHCDTRKWMKGAKHYYPILEWSEKDVWSYIRENNLPYHKYYDPPYNFKRHGCVGCPLASNTQQIKEFKIFPKYILPIIKAIRIYMENKPASKMAKTFDNEWEVFYWWLSNKSIIEFISLRDAEIWSTDYELQIRKEFKI